LGGGGFVYTGETSGGGVGEENHTSRANVDAKLMESSKKGEKKVL